MTPDGTLERGDVVRTPKGIGAFHQWLPAGWSNWWAQVVFTDGTDGLYTAAQVIPLQPLLAGAAAFSLPPGARRVVRGDRVLGVLDGGLSAPLTTALLDARA